MDSLILKKYFIAPSNEKKHRGGNTVDVNNSFLEFYINDQPLFALLDSFYGSKRSNILKNNVGVLGSFSNIPLEIIKVKQLIGKNFNAEDFAELKKELTIANGETIASDIVDRVKDEIAHPEIMIYCCAQCGDYYCGGVTVSLRLGEDYVTWEFNDEDRKLTFVFDKYDYFDRLKSYLVKIKSAFYR